MFIFKHCMTSSNLGEISTPGWKSVACVLSQHWAWSILGTLDFLKWSIKLFLWGFVMMLVVLLTEVVLIRDLREISDQLYLSTSTISTRPGLVQNYNNT